MQEHLEPPRRAKAEWEWSAGRTEAGSSTDSLEAAEVMGTLEWSRSILAVEVRWERWRLTLSCFPFMDHSTRDDWLVHHSRCKTWCAFGICGAFRLHVWFCVCVCVCVCLCVCVSVSSGGSALFNLLVPCACPRRAGSCPRRAGRGSRSRSVRAAGKLPGSVRAGGRKGDTARAQREPED